ncbi:MAG: hypothetical protein DVB22_002786 [Verrucomicrobia bacterium]|nr:MAG: hypothetical protein DVB22_002786 [Verrucomicrobiota bacterium]
MRWRGRTDWTDLVGLGGDEWGFREGVRGGGSGTTKVTNEHE